MPRSAAPTDSPAVAAGLADLFSSQFREFSLEISRILARENVSLSQFCLFGFLAENPQMTMSEIDARMRHTTAAATGTVDRLETLKHIRRGLSSEDRRKVWVEITESGRALIAEMQGYMMALLNLAMNSLSKEEQQQWLAIVSKMPRYHQFP